MSFGMRLRTATACKLFWSPIVSGAFLLVLFVSNQITTLSWSLGGQVVLNDFLKLDLPGWLHCATIRIIVIVSTLYFVWSSRAEGMHQLLIFTQVLAALLLPSSVIPLFQIATSPLPAEEVAKEFSIPVQF